MTDNEIIKALENAKLVVNDGDAETLAFFDSLIDFINRQKAEIEKLEKENTVFREIIKKQDDEISALRKDLLKRENLEESFSKSVKQFDKRLEKTVKLERAEAYKEFAARLKTEYAKGMSWFKKKESYYVDVSDIDNLVKEMVGDDNA